MCSSLPLEVVYRAISYVGFGGAMPALLVHPKLRDGVRRRFGVYPKERPWPPSRGDGPRIWLHGASAGDLIALMPVIHEIRKRSPSATLIVSTMTNSGFAIAEDRVIPHADGITYVPYDLPGATKRAADAIRPDLLVLEYTEIWPNLIDAVRRQGARVAISNGRFSEALMSRYRWFYALIGNPLAKIDLLLMRDPSEAERALALGAPRDRVMVTGNTKFDNVAKGPDPELVGQLRGIFGLGDEPVFVAGSTHDGEERGLITAYRGLRRSMDNLRMIIAPRYTERGQRIAAIARSMGFVTALRSEQVGEGAQAKSAEVIVLDTIGELLAAYSLASIVFVGGSFVDRGGQNILEPAGLGRPVLFGPYMMNFRDSVDVLQGRGGIQVGSFDQLETVARALLLRTDELNRIGDMARTQVQRISGAASKNAEELLKLASAAQKARTR